MSLSGSLPKKPEEAVGGHQALGPHVTSSITNVQVAEQGPHAGCPFVEGRKVERTRGARGRVHGLRCFAAVTNSPKPHEWRRPQQPCRASHGSSPRSFSWDSEGASVLWGHRVWPLGEANKAGAEPSPAACVLWAAVPILRVLLASAVNDA